MSNRNLVLVLAAELLDTCKTLDEVLPSLGVSDLTQEQAEALDREVMCCTSCGWWCDSGETSIVDDEVVCGDCV